MSAAAERLEFAPTQPPGMVRSIALALLAHALLMGALTWGVTWRHHIDQVTVQAEIWTALPQAAAPPPPEPVPEPVPPAPVVAPPVVQPDPDIAIERERAKREQQQAREREIQAEREREQKAADLKLRKEELARQQEAAKKAQAEKLKQQEAAKKALAAERLKQEDADNKALEQQHRENVQRMLKGVDGATGAPGATGTAVRSGGPSAGYAARIAAIVRANIVFTQVITGNPAAEVEVTTAADGSITGRKLTKSSGIKGWDDAVLNAIDKTQRLPADIDGKVPSRIPFTFRPKD